MASRDIMRIEDHHVLFGIHIDFNLSLNEHINTLCKKASAKLNELNRISGYINFSKLE